MSRRPFLAIGIAALVIFAPVVSVTATTRLDCGPGFEPSFTDTSFARVEDRLTSAVHPPLAAVANLNVDLEQLAVAQVMRQPTRAPGSVQLVVGFGDAADPSIIVYYAKDPLDPSATFVDFLRTGGIAYARQPAAGGNATGVIASVGMRAVAVRIADYDGAIVHADPVETNDLRFFELHWSDGQSDFTVYGNVSGATAIDVARSIYCA